jgi:phosphomannomutase
MIDTLNKIKEKVYIGIVGGSDYKKQIEQLGENLKLFDFIFAENGLHSFKGDDEFHKQSILKHLGEDKLQEFINFVLGYFSQLKLPKKRGTFIEFRNGMMNISPIGRNCSHDERDEFELYDKEHKIRQTMVEILSEKFKDLNLTYSIGGQISFDVFPKGWDKTYCLQFLTEFKTIHFFGDKTHKGGNDHEIYEHERTIGHKVTKYEDTIAALTEMFKLGN